MSGEVTRLLARWSGGDDAALNALSPLIYDELHRLAQSSFRGENPGHTLQPTAIVHEAFEKLVDADVSYADRGHFYALAARMMRRLLINHANEQRAQKRGGGIAPVTLDEGALGDMGNAGDVELIELGEAIAELEKVDERKSQLIELQYFVGLTFAEMSEMTGLSTSTLDRELRLARAWLQDYLHKT